ncbi:DAK2 domain fusion protein YloV [Nocardia africana]|uniref:DAK2 domain fusion protein YloV n=1 Tax=Nocardia africana TaxID=134964 RepID=A0A378X197_9NOCA|nr:DAK2 domain fusion protein YloV [Nocardia africana]
MWTTTLAGGLDGDRGGGKDGDVRGVRERLDAAALRQWGALCVEQLLAHREEINALNVFPVADSDTGTNLLITMRAALAATEVPGDADLSGAADPLGAMARAATAAACGNSGIILSQVLRGLAESADRGVLTAATLRAALRRAAVLVRESLSEPVEGTMLTVLEAAADRAEDCAEETVAAVAVAAADGAVKALGETPSQLVVLRAAGVVDAGARGLLVLLDALVEVCTGSAPARPVYRVTDCGPVRRAAAPVRRDAPGDDSPTVRSNQIAAQMNPSAQPEGDRPDVLTGDGSVVSRDASEGFDRAHIASLRSRTEGDAPPMISSRSESGTEAVRRAGQESARRQRARVPQYEVMYRIGETDPARIDRLRRDLAALGDSVVVVGDGEGSWSAHVHCADAGAAVEAGLAAGTLGNIRIEGLFGTSVAAHGQSDRGILAIATGAGAVRLFEDSGAVVLTGAVTADRLLAAIRAMPQREVLVLPNGALPAPELVAIGMAARDGWREVMMLPSGSMVQGLAALALHDSGSLAVDDALTMSQSAASTRWGAVRVATERALTIVGTCEQGDGLGLVGHDVVVIDPDLRRAARTLLDRMLGLGGELVTLLLGAQAPAGLADELTAHITTEFPGVEVVTYDGGQAVDLVQIGVE